MVDPVIYNLFIIGYFCRGNINTLDEYSYNYFVNEFYYFKLFSDLFPENEIADQDIFHKNFETYYKTITYIRE
jgi:hypothetical protein